MLEVEAELQAGFKFFEQMLVDVDYDRKATDSKKQASLGT